MVVVTPLLTCQKYNERLKIGSPWVCTRLVVPFPNPTNLQSMFHTVLKSSSIMSIVEYSGLDFLLASGSSLMSSGDLSL